ASSKGTAVGGCIKQNTVDLELGLLWRREYEAFNVTLHSTSASKEDEHIEVPYSPLKLDPDDFAILPAGDPGEYAQELTRNVFAVDEARQLSEQREQIYHGVFMDLTMSRQRWRWAPLLVVVLSAVAIVVIVLARI